LRAQLNDLQLGFRLADVRLAGALIPSVHDAGRVLTP
jgi:hypothetical protein